MKIDVVMLTKNSFSRHNPEVFLECLSSIKREIPVNNFVVVDAFSSDRTINIVKSYFRNALIIKDKALRGKARQIGISLVNTDWFAFVDSDVVLCRNWFSEMRKRMIPKIGAIEGRVRQISGNISKFRPYGRGLTHCVIIRTSAVKDIIIPSEMNYMEDHYIRKHIERKGYIWLKLKRPISKHYRTKKFGDDLQAVRQIGIMKGKYDLTPFWKDLIVLFKIPFKTNLERKALIWNLIGRLEGELG